MASPIKLQPNKRYPSYQLYAVAGTSQMDPEKVFKVCVLHTYKWLRARFDAFWLRELALPDPSEAGSFDLSALRSVGIADPYPVEVFWLPEDKAWCLKLREPDNGNPATDYRPAREGVRGRIFETNIAFRMTENGVECGFSTIVSEPQDVEEQVESFRLACIKDIARDPNAGLYHGFKLQDEPISIGNSSDVKRLVRWIRSEERQLPVIISDLGTPRDAGKRKDAVPSVEDFLAAQSSNLMDRAVIFATLRPSAELLPAARAGEQERVDINKLARYKMGYAQYFVVSAEMSALIAKELSPEYGHGAFNVFEPAAFGGHTGTLDAFSPGTEQSLDSFAAEYPARKPMTFGGVLFASDAREIASRNTADLAGSKEALAQAYEERIAAISSKHEDDLASWRTRVDDEHREVQRRDKAMEAMRVEFGREIEDIRKQHEQELSRLKASYADDLFELQRYRDRERRPTEIGLIADWVDREFGGKLILHEKAKAMLSALKTGEWDVGLICDALEFLATDYRDELLGIISENDMMANCSRKYGRPFDVTPLTLPPVARAPKEYKIKYYPGFKGEPVDSLLDLHLRIGNTAEDLLRIYFLYDKENKLIVVGSLPKHLPTLSYR